MALIKCDECGRQISDQSVFCPGCGYPTSKQSALREAPEETPEAPAPVETIPAPPEPAPVPEPTPVESPETPADPEEMNRRNERAKMWLHITVFAVVIAIVAICFYIGGKGNSESAEAVAADSIESVDATTEVEAEMAADSLVEAPPTSKPAQVEAPAEQAAPKPAEKKPAGDPALLDMRPLPDEPDEPAPVSEPAPAPVPEAE